MQRADILGQPASQLRKLLAQPRSHAARFGKLFLSSSKTQQVIQSVDGNAGGKLVVAEVARAPWFPLDGVTPSQYLF